MQLREKYNAVTGDSRLLAAKPPLSTAEKWAPVLSTFPVSLTVTDAAMASDQPFSLHTHLPLSLLVSHCRPPVHDLLKSVPVSWARMRKERDWVVPVRGCQSSVSWISRFLLRSLGIKQGAFSILRPCLHAHTHRSSNSSSSTRQRWLTTAHTGTSPLHTSPR